MKAVLKALVFIKSIPLRLHCRLSFIKSDAFSYRIKYIFPKFFLKY